ncbi:hypothetical protein ECE50_005525 [Chitinophaga sp. Mgbs1]|uniref:Uncharacterized protein n=1 Tax=Chitinophaga solisilvae TaxID=1233460 RepID=A0A433WLA7_9BACT|nr:hypothetical protein [Chitinophaga solisilvae]
MTHRKQERMFNQFKLHGTLLAALLLAGTACNKSTPVLDGNTNPAGDPAAIAPEAAATGQLVRTSLGGNGLVQQISYNGKKQPLVILQYAGNFLTTKDSVVYDAGGKLLKVLSYAPDFFTKGKFTLAGNTTFEWDNNGRISRKITRDQETGSLEEDNRYTYDATGKVATITTSTNPEISKLVTVATLTYENKNVKKIVHASGTDVLSHISVTGFDNHPSYITHPLLPYLLELTDYEAFGEQNAVETRNVQYVNLGSKRDSIVTVTKNAYQYNAASRPVKVAFTSTIYSTGNQKPVTSNGTAEYTYGK